MPRSAARLAALVLLLTALTPPPVRAQWTRHVNVFTGTGGTGHTFPGATVPFGMVQLSPDTRRDDSWEGAAGYYHADSLVYGFSHTHLSGTGVSDYGDILVTAFYGDTTTAPDRYRQAFRHDREAGSPGYYAVTLGGRPGVSGSGGIRVRLTATPRVGVQEYTFPRAGEVTILVDLTHRDFLIASRLRRLPASSNAPASFAGMRRSRAWADDQHVYFQTDLSRAPDAAEIRSGPVGPTHALLRYRVRAGERILVRTALSSVSEDGAAANLAAEHPGWSFEATRRAADALWNAEIGRVAVTGGTERQRQNLYTALYHAFLAPNLWNDVDGRYRGRDGAIHTAPMRPRVGAAAASGRASGPLRRHDVYTVFSLWDTFRTAHPMLALLAPQRAADMAETLLRQYEQSGRLPVWELAANETNTMIGFHAAPVLLDAAARGVATFDADLALRAMIDAADHDGFGQPTFNRQGYLSADDEPESTSKTLEYAYDNWTVAEMARRVGRDSIARVFDRRALGYRNVFDAATGFMRPRRNGGWLPGFDPYDISNHYTEANAWQYSFFVPHDVLGWRAALGGPDALEARLDSLFSAPTETRGRAQPDVTGLIGQYAHGNEPSHTFAYLYAATNAPHKTQRLVRTVLDSLYAPTPDGLPGNEDCGQMSAWFVMSALGIYPATPGTDRYVLTAPLFPSARIDVGGGRVLRIETRGRGRYVRSVSMNGRALGALTLVHADLVRGGRLVFDLSETPVRWGRIPDALTTRVNDADFVAAPLVTAGDRSFDARTRVAVEARTPGAVVWATLDGTAPVPGRSRRMTEPVAIDATTTLRAVAVLPGGATSGETRATFVRRPNTFAVTLADAPAPAYATGGARALTDGITGTANWRAGDWLGFWGPDLDATLDLGAIRPVRAVSARFLQDVRPWIVFPRAMTVEISLDGAAWTPVLRATHDRPVAMTAPEVMTLGGPLAAPVEARYVRIRGLNYGTLPAWHPGAGYDAYVFVDEITVE